MKLKWWVAGLIGLVLVVVSVAGSALAQTPTPNPDRANLPIGEFELVREWIVEGGAITHAAAAPDGSLTCVVTDDTLLTCTDRAGGGFTQPHATGIIAILIGLKGDVVTVQPGDEGLLISRIRPTGETTMLTAQIDGVYLDDIIIGATKPLVRIDPAAHTLFLAGVNEDYVIAFDISQLDGPASDYEPEPLNSWVVDFNVRDMTVMPDGSLIALGDDGQLYRARPGGIWGVLPGDFNGDGVVDVADYLTDSILINDFGQDHVFVADTRSDPISGETTFAIWQINTTTTNPTILGWNFLNGWPSKTAPLNSVVMGDGSVMFATSDQQFYRVGPTGAVAQYVMPGDNMGQLVLFSEPLPDDLYVTQIDASTPKLTEFRLRQ